MRDDAPANAPWLSVLVPAHGVERYLDACLASVLAQDSEGVEVLVLDDASPDRSGEIAAGWQARHPHVVRCLVHERNRGLSTARNSLLDAARGRYAWFLDADDMLLPGAIAELRAVVDADAPDLVLCDFRLLRDRSGLRHRLRGESHCSSCIGAPRAVSTDRNLLLSGLLESRQLHTWSKIAKREVWRQARFPENRCFQDMAVIPQLVSATTSWRHAASPWVAYRQRDDSIQAVMTPAKARDALASMRDLRAGLAALPGGLDHKTQVAVDYFCLRAFATLARRLPAGSDVDAVMIEAMGEIFPDGAGQAIRQCRRRGWWLRAWRARRSLAKCGWL